jgi:WGR domain
VVVGDHRRRFRNTGSRLFAAQRSPGNNALSGFGLARFRPGHQSIFGIESAWLIQTLRWTKDKVEPTIRDGECLRTWLFTLHIILERVDPARNIARYYVLSIEPTLFAKHTLIRRWGRIGSFGGNAFSSSGVMTPRKPK